MAMEPVDLALVLAVDVSASVDFDEFRLMVGGLAAALREPAVQAAMFAGPRGAVALSAVFWSEAAEAPLRWRRLATAADADGAAEALEAAPRLPRAAATALGEGLAASLAQLAGLRAVATRMAVDVSGDGWLNRGRALEPVRELARQAGVTVNGLAVLNEEPELLARYRDELITGPGAFAMACADYADFADAMLVKLLREVRGPEALSV